MSFSWQYGAAGASTNGLKARRAACHKKSRLSAGCVGACAVCLLYKKYPRLGRGSFLLFNHFFNNFVRFGFGFSEFYGLGKQG